MHCKSSVWCLDPCLLCLHFITTGTLQTPKQTLPYTHQSLLQQMKHKHFGPELVCIILTRINKKIYFLFGEDLNLLYLCPNSSLQLSITCCITSNISEFLFLCDASCHGDRILWKASVLPTCHRNHGHLWTPFHCMWQQDHSKMGSLNLKKYSVLKFAKLLHYVILL